MKLKHILPLAMCITLLFSACTTTKKVIEPDPNYIGNFEPIQLDNILCIQESMGKLQPLELETYFIPRTNNVEIYFRKGLNNICIIFEVDERKGVYEGIMQYAEDIALYMDGNKNALPEREATRSNYYTEGTASIAWGVMGLSRNNTTTYQTNYQYLEQNKPYFELMIEKTIDKNDGSTYSPVTRIYFSPTHLENLLETLSQEALVALVKDKEAEAFAF